MKLSSRWFKSFATFTLSLAPAFALLAPHAAVQAQAAAQTSFEPGSSQTLLGDGTWLVVSSSQSWLVDPHSGARRELKAQPHTPRSFHAALVVPDGSVWLLGGVDRAGTAVRGVERYRPDTQSFEPIDALALNLIARSRHSATLLLDGRILLVGGQSAQGQALADIELIDPASRSVESWRAQLTTPRYGHQAAYQFNDNILIQGGSDRDGKALAAKESELFERGAQRMVAGAQAAPDQTGATPAVLTSLPTDQAQEVSVATRIGLRFNHAMRMQSINSSTVILMGPAGRVAAQVSAAEGGLLAFVSPAQQLLPGATYSVLVSQVQNAQGQPVALWSASFRTQSLSPGQRSSPHAVAAPKPGVMTGAAAAPTPLAGTDEEDDDEHWIPSGNNYKGNWTSGREGRALNNPPRREQVRRAVHGQDRNPNSEVRSKEKEAWSKEREGAAESDVAATALGVATTLPTTPGDADGLPSAPAGVTALAGQVLRLNGKPLAHVTLHLGGVSTQTDANGEFLLTDIPSGAQVLGIEGASANQGKRVYGRYDYRLNVQAGQTNALPFIVWMPVLDTQNAVKVASPSTKETIVTNPKLPGLELRIPAGTVIRDVNGKIVTEVSITPVPVDQAPFPMSYLGVPIYFTLQPGGATLHSADGQPKYATLHYPNYALLPPGAITELFDYDPKGRGWYIYGHATVSADTKTLIARQELRVYQFTSTSVATSGGVPGENNSAPCMDSDCCSAGSQGPDGAGGEGGWGNEAGAGKPGCDSTMDPVSASTGHQEHTERDLYIADIIPIDVRRVYRSGDVVDELPNVRTFGGAFTHPYEIYLYVKDGVVSVVLPNGARIQMPYTSAFFYDPSGPHTATQGRFYGAYIARGSAPFGLVLHFRDGRKWGFSYYGAKLQWVEDANGNRLTIDRVGGVGPVSRITSPGGRTVDFVYNASNLVESITDQLGRKFTYTYTGNLLTQVTDPLGGTPGQLHEAPAV